jgi:alcohol dehydrogenase
MYCIEGNPQVCDHQFQPGFTHWGSFAPHVAIKYAENNLVTIPEYLDFSSAAILGCRFATSFRALVDQGKLRPGQWVAVHGCGGVGLSAIMISRALKARIIAVDMHEPQLQLAEELGAEYIIDASQSPVNEQIMDLSGGGVHISIDAVGKADIVKTSIRSLRKGGRHIQIGLMDPENREIALPMDYIIARELGIIGSHGMQADRYSVIIEMIRKGLLRPAELVKNAISLKESLSVLPKLNQNHKPGITVINDFIL